MSSQTVYFTNPAVISSIQSSQTSMSGSIATQTTQISSMSGSVSTLQSHQYDIGNQCWGKFLHGVMSGDPTSTSCVIMTNLTVNNPDFKDNIVGYWIVGTGCIGDFSNPASDVDPNTLISKGRFRTGRTIDYSVKLKLNGLNANTQYYYKFYSILPGGYSQINSQYLLNNRGPTSINEYNTYYDKSPIGRFKTLPTGATSNIRFAAVSCQAIGSTFFNHMYQMSKAAQAGKLDYLLSCGDFVYIDTNYYKIDSQFKHFIDENGLRTYPTKYSQFCTVHRMYKQDPDWQECMRSLSFIYVFNDHDVVRNNLAILASDRNQAIMLGPDYNYLYDPAYPTIPQSVWVNNPGAQAGSTFAKTPNSVAIPTGATGPLDNTTNLYKTGMIAWYDHYPIYGSNRRLDVNESTYNTVSGYQVDRLQRIAGSTDPDLCGYFSWTSTGGVGPLEKTYTFGDLVSIHILDDSSQVTIPPEVLNPYYNNKVTWNPLYPPSTGTYTLISNPSGPYTTVFIPPVTGTNITAPMPLFVDYGSNTGAFLSDLKTILRWQDYVSSMKQVLDSQMTNLYNAMTGANTKWKVLLTGYSEDLLPSTSVTDGAVPSTMSASVVETNVFQKGAYTDYYIATGAVLDTLKYIGKAQKELYDAGSVSSQVYYPSKFLLSKRHANNVYDLLSNFNNVIVIGGDNHTHMIGHLHSSTGTEAIFSAGRNATGIWNNYTTGSSGAINNASYPIVGALFEPICNQWTRITGGTPTYTSQGTTDKNANNGHADLIKYQDPRIVDFNNGFLNNSRGFTLFDISSTGCNVRNFFVGGHNVTNQTNTVKDILFPSNATTLDVFGNSLIYREDKLEVTSQYLVPYNTGAFRGTSPIQIVKPMVRFDSYLPDGYPYKIPVNCTSTGAFASYNTPITISQL